MNLFDRGTLLAAGGGAAVGALAAHLFDPSRGRSRRARYADRVMGVLRSGTRGAARTGRVVGSAAQGKLEAMRAGTGGQRGLDDAAMSEKVESLLFRDPTAPKGSINVNVEHGVVVLRGEVDEQRVRRQLEDRAGKIPGVVGVENQLRVRRERRAVPQPTN